MAFISPLPLHHVNQSPHTQLISSKNSISTPPNMSMRSDNRAPVISVRDTKSDQTSRIGVAMPSINLNESIAADILSRAALTATMTRKSRPQLSQTSSDTSKMSKSRDLGDESPRQTVVRCFPDAYRGSAPVITLDKANENIRVSWDKIEKMVNGVNSGDAGGLASAQDSSVGATKSEPFWKKQDLKWVKLADKTAIDHSNVNQQNRVSESSSTQEVLDTSKFERYFPTRIRNRAPLIELRGPKGEWDKTAYLKVGNEYVQLKESLARRVQTPKEKTDSDDTPDVRAAATVEKYYGGDRMNKAPVVEIDKDRPSVVFQLNKVELDKDLAGEVAKNYQSPENTVNRNYPQSSRNRAPDIKISKDENKVEVGVGYVQEEESKADDVRNQSN